MSLGHLSSTEDTDPSLSPARRCQGVERSAGGIELGRQRPGIKDSRKMLVKVNVCGENIFQFWFCPFLWGWVKTKRVLKKKGSSGKRWQEGRGEGHGEQWAPSSPHCVCNALRHDLILLRRCLASSFPSHILWSGSHHLSSVTASASWRDQRELFFSSIDLIMSYPCLKPLIIPSDSPQGQVQIPKGSTEIRHRLAPVVLHTHLFLFTTEPSVQTPALPATS